MQKTKVEDDINMKAYKVNISFIDSDPIIWRSVVIPADVTFNRLHDIIQNVTNFQSGYPYEDIHLFEFNLTEDNIRVTNDIEAYDEHKGYMKNRRKVEAIIRKDTTPKMAQFQEMHIKNLQTVIRKPVGIKIDNYIEKYGELVYSYDFGDGWEILIKLEEIVHDYKFGYPLLLDGAKTAPPEDVGGLHGFEEFLTIYYDANHPTYEQVRLWARKQYFREYDPEHINTMLKFIKYKKNE